jgi:uncharacterized protein (TIGR02452 family)
MKYRIEISSVAEAQADTAFLSLSQLTSSAKASQWHGGLLEAIESLSVMPNRCSFARENEYFSQEIRQLIYGRGRAAYRILFTILDLGCGVFCNDPSMVADVFGRWLEHPRFLGCFDKVIFAIYTSNQNIDTLTAFQTRFRSTN